MIIDLGRDKNRLYIPILNRADLVGYIKADITDTATNESNRYIIFPSEINNRYIALGLPMLTKTGIYLLKIIDGGDELYKGFLRVIDSTNKEEIKTPELSSDENKIKFYDGK
ncbi:MULTISPECIES: hypothetical protein [Sphingobacterium]|uniref:hypothetical protein n=1 Tax=Sphingobacterium TaxID=28453 RepID=UPI0013DC1565|nr:MULTISPECIES: hypothetical protein [unclassified Sphingobacterium]